MTNYNRETRYIKPMKLDKEARSLWGTKRVASRSLMYTTLIRQITKLLLFCTTRWSIVTSVISIIHLTKITEFIIGNVSTEYLVYSFASYYYKPEFFNYGKRLESLLVLDFEHAIKKSYVDESNIHKHFFHFLYWSLFFVHILVPKNQY